MSVADSRERRKPGQQRSLWASLAIVAALTTGCTDGPAPTPGPTPAAGAPTADGSKPAAVAKSSPEQEAVRKWLAENTDSGKWEEVRWWDAIELAPDPVFIPFKTVFPESISGGETEESRKSPSYQKVLAEKNAKAKAEHEESVAAYAKDVAAGTQMKYVRLKYRTESGGGPKLFDEVFKISAGKVFYNKFDIDFYGRNFPD